MELDLFPLVPSKFNSQSFFFNGIKPIDLHVLIFKENLISPFYKFSIKSPLCVY